jgi:hypothetical protein
MTTNTPLTRTMQPVVEAIGFDAATILVTRFGGRRIYLALSPTAGNEVVSCIGAVAARRLAAIMGAGPFDVPRCLVWLAALRRERVVSDRAAGVTVADLAEAHGYTERHVWRILRDAELTTEDET